MKEMNLVEKRIYLEKFTSVDFDKYYELVGNFKVMEASTNKFIGSALLKVKEKNSSEAELGYMLLPSYWGKRFGSEVAELLIEKAEREKQLNKIIAIIDPNNIASRKILINNGFTSDRICEIDGLPGEILSMKI